MKTWGIYDTCGTCTSIGVDWPETVAQMRAMLRAGGGGTLIMFGTDGYPVEYHDGTMLQPCEAVDQDGQNGRTVWAAGPRTVTANGPGVEVS